MTGDMFSQLGARIDANGKRIDANRDAQRRTTRRIYVLAIFVVLAFLLLALRSERSDVRISGNTERISGSQQVSCLRGRAIVGQFNDLQNKLASIEARNMSVTREIRESRIATYQAARILPLPVCLGNR